MVADSVAGAAKDTDVAERQYFIDARNGKASGGQVVKSKIGGHPVGIACAPVLSESKMFLGAVVLTIKIDYLAEIVDSCEN